MIETTNELIIELLNSTKESKEIFIQVAEDKVFKRPTFIDQDELGINIHCEDAERIHYPSSLINHDITKLCEEFHIDASIIEEALINALDSEINKQLDILYDTADLFDEDKGYYYHRMDKLEEARNRLFRKYNIE